MNYKLCADPGAIMDMYFVFIIYFNQESWETHIADTADDLIYYKNIVEEIGEIDQRCAVFFKQRQHTMSFFSRMVFIRTMHDLGGKINISDIFNILNGSDIPVRQLLWDFWTDNAPMPDNSYDIARYISNTLNCDENVKQLLIAYFDDPDIYEKSLKNAIADKYDIILEMRKKYAVDMPRYIEALDADPDTFLDRAFTEINCEKMPSTQYISFCLLHRKIIYIYQSPNIILLGLDYLSNAYGGYTNDLTILANALKNPDQMNIIKYIMKNGESSMHEISAALGMHLDAASYQLVVLDNAKIVIPHQLSGTTFYKFRPGIFSKIATLI